MVVVVQSVRKRGTIMGKIDAAALEALVQTMNSAVQELDFSAKAEEKNIRWVKANFIKHFTEDVFFLNDHSEDRTFSHRNGNLIIRNMLEQLIEFLYLLKNPHRAEEYLGFTVDLKNFDNNQSLIEKAKFLGEKRYNKEPVKSRRHGKEQKVRPAVSEMAEDIDEKHCPEGTLNLYMLYQLLSDECHNSYFSALLADVHKVHHSTPTHGLSKKQLNNVMIMIAIVLKEFNQMGQDNISSAN